MIPASNKPPQKWPLRLVLILPFVLQISTAVGLTGWLSLRNGQRAVDDLAAQLESEVVERTQQHLTSYLQVPHQLNQVNAEAVRLGLLNLEDPVQLSRTFWKQVTVYPSISYIYFAKQKDGGYVDAGREESGSMVIEQTQNYTAGDFYIYRTDDQARPTRILKVEPDYDPRNRPWYTVAVGQKQPIWSEIYPMFSDKILAITASMPVYDQNGTFFGVFGADLTLAQLSAFLQKLHIGKGGQAAIIERSGIVVAQSTPDLPFRQAKVGADPERVTLSAVESPVLREAAAHLDSAFGGLQDIRAIEQRDFYVDGERYYLQVAPYRDSMGLDWLILVAVPESDFMAQIHANTRQTILLSLGALVAAIALGIYTSRWIIRPIQELNRASEAIAMGKLDHTLQPQNIREMDSLAQSFNHMTSTLKELFQQLEQANLELEDRVETRTVELSKALEQLKKAQLKLVQTEKMSSLGQLVAGIAHEINNPVNFIHGNLSHASDYANGLLELLELYTQLCPQSSPRIQKTQQLMDLEFIQEDFPRLISSMRLGANRIREIVQSLRDFSRLEETEVKSVNLHDSLDHALTILYPRLQGTVESCGEEEGDRLPIDVIHNYGNLPLVEGYPGQLNQVFFSLLSNAIDALEERQELNQCPETAFTPTISIQTQVLDDQWVTVSVRDNGFGIPEKFQSKLFDPFFTTKPVGKGSGLGLFIAYRIIVDQHNGELNFVSTPSKGTEFTVKLPVFMELGFIEPPSKKA